MNSPQERGEFTQKHASQLKLNQQARGEDKLAKLEAAHALVPVCRLSTNTNFTSNFFLSPEPGDCSGDELPLYSELLHV